MKNIVRFLKDKSGATAIEYGLIAALIAVAIIGGVSAVGDQARTTFDNVDTAITAGNAKMESNLGSGSGSGSGTGSGTGTGTGTGTGSTTP